MTCCWRITKDPSHDILRAACLQNEIVPEKLLNQYEKRFEKRDKGSEKRSETRLKKCLAPLRPLKNISPALFNKSYKFFTAQNLYKKKVFCSPRGSAGEKIFLKPPETGNLRSQALKKGGSFFSFSWSFFAYS